MSIGGNMILLSEILYTPGGNIMRSEDVQLVNLINQLVLHSVMHEFGVRFHTHLFQDSGAVSADCAVAQRKNVRNLTGRPA